MTEHICPPGLRHGCPDCEMESNYPGTWKAWLVDTIYGVWVFVGWLPVWIMRWADNNDHY